MYKIFEVDSRVRKKATQENVHRRRTGTIKARTLDLDFKHVPWPDGFLRWSVLWDGDIETTRRVSENDFELLNE